MRKWKDLEERGIGKKRWSDDGREWVRERKRERKRVIEREIERVEKRESGRVGERDREGKDILYI